MSLAIYFWLFMILWAVSGWFAGNGFEVANRTRWWGFSLFLFVLLFILGWKVFGFAVRGG
jgi:putative Mn2+ efflux pump MntP